MLWRRIASTVPSENADANLARFHIRLQLRFEEFVQHPPRSVEFLVRVSPHHNIDAGLLLRIRKVAHEVSLHACLQLAENAACEALLAIFKDARDVGLRASILVREFVSILVPHALQTLLDLADLTWHIPRLGRMWVFLQMGGLDFVQDFLHDNSAEFSLSEVRSVKTVQAVGTEDTSLHVSLV